MNPPASWWALAPIPAALSLAGVTLAAVRHRTSQLPGFGALVAVTLLGLFLHVATVALQWAPTPSSEWLVVGAWVGTPILAALWATLAVRAGQQGTVMPNIDLALLLAAWLAAFTILVWSLQEPGPMLVVSPGQDCVVGLTSGPARGAAGLALLAGALGVLRFAGLRAAALPGRPRLRRLSAGPLIVSLGIYLFASQALLYGSASLRIFSLATLLEVPACWIVISSLARPADPAGGVRPAISSTLLLALGLFLICLAVLGEALHLFLPTGGLLWFHWGSVILLLAFGTLWLVPGVRTVLRAWLDPARELRVDVKGETARAAALLSGAQNVRELGVRLQPALEALVGTRHVILWTVADDGACLPALAEHVAYPPLPEGNALRVALYRRNGRYLDFTRPPQRLADLRPYVENLDLIEKFGLNVFVSLRAAQREVGLLGVGLKPGAVESQDVELVRAFAPRVAEVVLPLLRGEARGHDAPHPAGEYPRVKGDGRTGEHARLQGNGQNGGRP